MILPSFLFGMAHCAVAFSLISAEGNEPGFDKFASAVAQFAAWCAFGMLLMAGTYGLGIFVPAFTAALVLLFRSSGIGQRFVALAPYKMPIGIVALVASVFTWIGVLNLMEELPNV